MGRPPKDPADRYRTPRVSARVPEPLRDAMREITARNGETETDFILRAIQNEIRRTKRRT